MSSKSSSQKRVWIITPGEPAVYHPAVQSAKTMRSAAVAKVLAEQGHEVIWWTGAFQHHNKMMLEAPTRPMETDVPGLRLGLVPSPGYRSNVSFSRLKDYSVLAQNWSRMAQVEVAPDVIVASWPPVDLGYAALRYAQGVGARFAVDARDMWPDVIYERLKSKTGLPVPPFLLHYNRMTKTVYREADAVFGVTDAFVDWGRAKGVCDRKPIDRAFFLSSDPLLDPEPVARAKAQGFWEGHGITSADGATRIISVSTLADHKAMRDFFDRFSKLPPALATKAQLVICGEGDLKPLIANYGNRFGHMIYAGYIGKAAYSTLLSMSHFGLMAYDPTFDFINSIPNKVNEYLSGGIELVTNLNGEAYRLLAPHGVVTLLKAQTQDAFNAEIAALIARRETELSPKTYVQDVYAKYFDSTRIYNEMSEQIIKLANKAVEA